MDLEEWEILPDDGFLEIHDDGGKRIFSRKYRTHRKTLFKTNYFICPSSPPNPQDLMQPKGDPGPPQSQFVPIPLEPNCKEEGKVEINPAPIQARSATEAPNTGGDDEQDTISQVFFKKMKENEFVDMKMDSPRCSSREVVPQPDPFAFPQFEDKGKAAADKEVIANSSDPDDKGGPFAHNNIWKWSLTGIGAICSFGVAAATVCIIFLGNSAAAATKRNKQGKHTQQLRFQIYSDDQSIKQVVHQQASKWNDAISAARGVPFARAQVTFGGHYDGL